jgi:3-phenylpropionate/trans-cinnamate dioxygenase ferredoxin subunit
VRARSYPVAVEPGRRLLEGPYVVETFPVEIEHDYLVIDAPDQPRRTSD